MRRLHDNCGSGQMNTRTGPIMVIHEAKHLQQPVRAGAGHKADISCLLKKSNLRQQLCVQILVKYAFKSNKTVQKFKDQNYSTQYSHVVTHHSTNWAITSLSSEIRRDPELSSMYGRSWQNFFPLCHVPCIIDLYLYLGCILNHAWLSIQQWDNVADLHRGKHTACMTPAAVWIALQRLYSSVIL